MATFPLDLVRRRKQLEGAGGRAPVYTTGLFGIFKQIYQTEGFRGLYRGIMPEYYKMLLPNYSFRERPRVFAWQLKE
ncbi:hypothetical protein OIU76_012295 [Salix suchowensis]|uniref:MITOCHONDRIAL SUBSTRATE CARRIER FAMILY PROTEIN n=2 Tax=Salix TaxID=40685 RepID=A0A9Q0WTB4_9ROSI|nr:hypothetical protein OIU76_012295 [Salix suchowensis]KAJ6717965.1 MITOCHONDRIAL SUBSTRATE CARRIER FAMILY PROTEIN [Salix purpurea]KAJ6772704.1 MITOCHONDRIAL SUBSTRATE CARRIER FAMILY PROTEIN [Salix koriyanagi]